MHTENLELLKKEATRLIDLESQLLTSIKDTEGLLSVNSESGQTFDANSLTQHLEVLSGERDKLKSMDMVVAVVGTMKAGKSTTINAIIGSEILPNRNGPMTSIPTLIRHAKGQREPLVTFKNNEPMNTLCCSLFDVLKNNPKRVTELCDESSDMAEVIDFIKSGEGVKPIYEGRKGIFKFLKTVNDLVRICRELQQPFPFSNYDEMRELPVIDVEFTSLSERECGLGNLILLDTPGPNEAGQQHLKAMLKDQLRKASAVITVLNYTQLKSESDEYLRNEVNAIAKIAKGRMYALVNKFDQRSYNDPDESGVKKMVSTLLGEDIPEECIFAVSAQQAFLGEVIQKFIQDNGALPDPEKHPWVEEFARDCFGRQWQAKINNVESVLDEARGYWMDSGFAQPLEKVVHAAHQNAAYYALDSTASKLVDLATNISNFVDTRETALKKTTEQLKNYIADLKEDVDRISALRKAKEKRSEKLFKALKVKVEKELSEAVDEATHITNQLFTKGVIERNEKRACLANAPASERAKAGKTTTDSQVKRKQLAGFFSGAGIKGHADSGEGDKLDTSNRILEFSCKKEASEFVFCFESALQPSISKLNKKMEASVSKALDLFDSKLKKEIAEESSNILMNISDRLGREGFEISLRVPSDIQARSLGLGSFSMGEGIHETTKTVTRLREQSGFMGGTKRFFGGLFDTDWGYDEVEEKIDIYKVSLDKLNSQTQQAIEAQGVTWRNEVKTEVEEPIRSLLRHFFDGLQKKVEVVRGDLLQGIDDQEKSEREQTELLKGVKAIAKKVPGIIEDSEGLKDDAQQNLEEQLA